MKGIERREYQINLFKIARDEDSLIVLPTGLGKTVIMGYLIEEFSDKGKIIVVAPTRPLVHQLYRFFVSHLEKPETAKIVELTGDVPPDKRALMYRYAKLIVATPQVIYNDVIKGLLDLSEVALLIFDEAHHATGSHHYVRIAELYRMKNPNGRVVGFTASPGSSYEDVLEVARNLGVTRIVARDETHPEVRPYVHERKLKIIRLEMDETTKKLLKLVDEEIERLKRKLEEEYGITIDSVTFKNVKAVIDGIKRGEIVADTKALGICYNLIRLSKLRELIETQGPPAVKAFFKSLEEKARTSSVVRELLNSPRIRYVRLLLGERKFPKLEKTIEVVEEFLKRNPNSRVIVFANYKETTKAIAQMLKNRGIKADRFTGRSDLSQSLQIAKVNAFKMGLIDVLVATSVGEEGIDVGEVDLVVFYDAVPSAIRKIQRMGRTGRRREGTVVVLLIKGTKDEYYFRLSRKRENSMRSLLKELEDVRLPRATSVEAIANPEGPVVLVDDRESRTAVVHELLKRGIRVQVEHLEVGDYVVGDVVIERKSFNDFSQSIIDGRLFQQALALKDVPKPLIIVEGEGSPRVGRRAFIGAVLSLMLEYRIPVIFTRDPSETAEIIELIAKKTKKSPRIVKAKPKGEIASRIAFLSMLPGVNETLATRLLKKFGTIRNVINASPGELMTVEGIGEKKATTIREFVNKRVELEERVFDLHMFLLRSPWLLIGLKIRGNTRRSG